MKKTFATISLSAMAFAICFLGLPAQSEASIGFSIGLGMGNIGFYNQPYYGGGYYSQPYVGVNNFNNYYGGGYASQMQYPAQQYSSCYQSCYGYGGGYNTGYNSAPFIDLGAGAAYGGYYQSYNQPYNSYNPYNMNMYGYVYTGRSCFHAPCNFY